MFEGKTHIDNAAERIKIETRRLAKNQRTWLNRLRARPGSLWLDAADATPGSLARAVVEHLNLPPIA
jgi:tRNA A37 N6-isopentenylltransferase MiaA